MSMNEGSMTSGSMGLGAAEGEMTTLRRELREQIGRLRNPSGVLSTNDVIPALDAVQAIVDAFDSRLRAIESKGEGVDGSQYDAPTAKPVAPTADALRTHGTEGSATYDGPSADALLGRETPGEATGATGAQASTSVGNG